MGSRWTPALAFGLLFLGGVAFAVLGVRQLTFERKQAERRAVTRTERLLERALTDLPRIAADPPGAPIETWTVATHEPIDIFEGVEEETALLFRQAEHHEHGGDPGRARETYARVANKTVEQPMGFVSALRAGILLRRVGPKGARNWLLQAASAPSDLVASGTVVKAAALYHLVLAGIDVDESWSRLRALSQEGVVLSQTLGASELLIELVAKGEKSDDPLTWRDVSVARKRASWGHVLLERFRSDGEGLVTLPETTVPYFARRRGDRIRLHSVDFATDWVSRIVEPYASVDEGPIQSEAIVRECPPPLQGLSIVVVPNVDHSGSRAALIALIVGLGIYVVGGALAMLAIRRSAKAARMQADFVAAVSHELKTPIASVRAMAEMLAEGGVKTPERAQTYARRIGAEMERLGTTVRNVLDVARIERQGTLPLTKELVDPAQIVEEATASMRPALERMGFTFDVRCEPSAVPISLDSEALKGVLVNLVDNAVKFSADEKHVEVDAGGSNDGYRISVADRGSGVRSEDATRVFERFYRGKAAKDGAIPGVGLGLHLVREVVAAHGGSVRAAPREGGGSVFTVELRGENA